MLKNTRSTPIFNDFKMELFKIILFLLNLNVISGAKLMEYLTLHAEKNMRSKIALIQIFVWNNQSKDFVSLANERWNKQASVISIYGKTIRAATVPMYPYIMFDNSTKRMTGLVGDLWNICEEYLHFQTDVNATDFDTSIALISEGISEVMLAAAVAISEFPLMEFSQPYYFYNSYQLYLKQPNETPNPMYFLRTLQPELWYACLIIFIILSISLRLTIYIINNAHQLYQKKIMEPSLSFLTCFLMVLSGFLNQGVDLHLNSLAARTQFFVALLFGYTVYAAISAVLVAELAVSDYPIPFKSVEDVVQKGYSMCVRTNSFLYTQLEENINKSAAWARYLNGPGCPRTQEIMAVKWSICERNAVFFESRAVMSKVILDPGWKCRVMTFGNQYFRKANSLIFFKGFRQKRIIAWFIERIRGSGILQKLTNQWIRQLTDNLNVPTFNEVTFIHIEGILMLYGGAIMFSFMIFLIEWVVYKFEKRQRI